MEEIYCSLILLALTLVTIFILYVVNLKTLGYEGIDLHCFVASYAFPGVIKKKTNNDGITTWLFKDVKLTDEIEIKVFKCLYWLLIILFFNVLFVFYRFLLLDGGYNCDKNDTETKNCDKLWRNKFENSSIECNNTAIQNGTDLEFVVCYNVVFNPVLALAVSYGTFKFSTFALSVASSGLLMIKHRKIVKRITKTTGILLLLACLPLFMFLLYSVILTKSKSSKLQPRLNNPTLIYVMQVSFSVLICSFFLLFPWGKLIALKMAQTEAVYS